MAFRETLRILRDNKYGFAHRALETMGRSNSVWKTRPDS